MNANRISSELDRTLAHAAQCVALAKFIEASMREFAPCTGQERLWRYRKSM